MAEWFGYAIKEIHMNETTPTTPTTPIETGNMIAATEAVSSVAMFLRGHIPGITSSGRREVVEGHFVPVWTLPTPTRMPSEYQGAVFVEFHAAYVGAGDTPEDSDGWVVRVRALRSAVSPVGAEHLAAPTFESVMETLRYLSPAEYLLTGSESPTGGFDALFDALFDAEYRAAAPHGALSMQGHPPVPSAFDGYESRWGESGDYHLWMTVTDSVVNRDRVVAHPTTGADGCELVVVHASLGGVTDPATGRERVVYRAVHRPGDRGPVILARHFQLAAGAVLAARERATAHVDLRRAVMDEHERVIEAALTAWLSWATGSSRAAAAAARGHDLVLIEDDGFAVVDGTGETIAWIEWGHGMPWSPAPTVNVGWAESYDRDDEQFDDPMAAVAALIGSITPEYLSLADFGFGTTEAVGATEEPAEEPTGAVGPIVMTGKDGTAYVVASFDPATAPEQLVRAGGGKHLVYVSTACLSADGRSWVTSALTVSAIAWGYRVGMFADGLIAAHHLSPVLRAPGTTIADLFA